MLYVNFGLTEPNDSHMQTAEGFDLNALPGSPALRRGVSQAMKVLDDIVSVAGKAPDRIYLKVTRTASNSRKGKRTTKRSDKIKQALKALDADAAADLGAAKLLCELGMFDEKEINERQNQLDLKKAELKKTADKAAAEADMVKQTVTAEKAHGEGVAAGIKAQTEAYNGMENAYLLANRYIDVMPEVAEAVAKPLTAVDSIKMYGDGNATKLVRDTTGMVDQVTSGLKDATGIDLTELLSSFHQPFQPREDNE